MTCSKCEAEMVKIDAGYLCHMCGEFARQQITKPLVLAVAAAIGATYGMPELDWTEEAPAALTAAREFEAKGLPK